MADPGGIPRTVRGPHLELDGWVPGSDCLSQDEPGSGGCDVRASLGLCVARAVETGQIRSGIAYVVDVSCEGPRDPSADEAELAVLNRIPLPSKVCGLVLHPRIIESGN